jgi:O-antigen chain-terminating methyltransferase
MRDAGVNARGVDLDETMAEFCRSRGLEVELNDAVSYLEHLDDSSLDGVFIDQVVEHLEPAYLVRLLELCHRKMKFGYYLVAETVNPLSFVSLANFYIDMTHVRPVHPATLKFLFGAAGFREIEAQFSSPVPDEVRLRRLPVDEGMGEAEKQRAEIYNMNVDLLNGTLYGAQDYAVIGKK